MNFYERIKFLILFLFMSLCYGAAQTPTNLGPIRTTYQDDIGRTSVPNPAVGSCRRYYNSTTGQESWINSTGGNCICGTSSANSIVYVGSGGAISCNSGASVGAGNENSIELPDNTTVANPATGSMKIAPLLGIPNLWEGATLLGQIITASNVGVANGVAGLDGSAVVPIAQEVTNTTNCDGSHVILGNRTCGSLSSSLPSVSTNQVVAGPSAYGASAATATGRALVPQDLPATAGQCPLDNALCTSAVDGNGNPNFLATVASLALPINGGTTPLVAFIAGKYQSLTSNITITLPGSAGIYFIYVNQDLSNANLVSADFGSTNIAPIYSKVAPTKVAAATSTNPQLWFDLSTNAMRANTAGTGGSFVAAPAIVLGAVDDTATQIDQVLCEPFRLDPNTRYRMFKEGGDGSQTVAGTVNKQGEFHYSAFEMTSGTYSTGQVSPFANVIYSQNVIIMMPGTTIGGTGQGLGGPGTSVNNGSAGGVGGIAGAGGGGGGGTAKTGGSGGGRTPIYSSSTTAGGAAGGAAGANNGSAGNSGVAGTNVPSFAGFVIGCMGSPGGGGGGDATNAGGNGGAAGSYEHIIAPALLIAGSAKIQADGSTPATPGAGNVGGGGGGGGGCAFIQAGYVNGTTANVTANGATGGTHAGTTVGDGGLGGSGYVKIQSIL